ncbi:MAG: cytidylate kinase-like family protein [Oscillospiraceae bacterium]|nr:cytidylate kinase-like family protein [Oscillospiraceae bacterium]
MGDAIITISREFGTGGKPIGEMLAKALGIPFYDKEIFQMAAEKYDFSIEHIDKSDEMIMKSFLNNLKHSAYLNFDTAYYAGFDSAVYYDTPVSDKVFDMQAKIIKEVAAHGSCVIVGRCADYILRNNPDLVRIFICGAFEDRMKYAVEYYKVPEKRVASTIKKTDKHRAYYYKRFTDLKWGDIHNHDLVINTSFTGVDGAVEIIKTLLDTKSTQARLG